MTPKGALGSYRCARAEQFAVKAWTDGMVVYDDASGSLHALTATAGEAFELLWTQQASSAEGLAHAMGLDEPDVEDLNLLESLLVQFESMGLITCAQG